MIGLWVPKLIFWLCILVSSRFKWQHSRQSMGKNENAVLQPSFVGYSHDSDRYCTASAEETPLVPFSIQLVIKLLDWVLFIFNASKKTKECKFFLSSHIACFHHRNSCISLKSEQVLWQDTLLNILSDIATFLTIIFLATASEHQHWSKGWLFF